MNAHAEDNAGASNATVYLVGAGPGDPGLLTVRAAELLGRADAVVYDRLVHPRILEHARPGAAMHDVGKQPKHHRLTQDQINELLIQLADSHRVIVRLKGGDPFIFGRGGEEGEALAAAGVPFEVVPGVTAAVAAAAYAGIPLTHRDWTTSVAFVTAHEDPTKDSSTIDFDALAGMGTIAIYMGVGQLPAFTRSLINAGLPADTPAAIIQRGTWPGQRTVVATAGTIADRAAEAGIQPPALTVIGNVVRCRESLNWFERRPLFGKRIMITRSRHQASQLRVMLEAIGASVIEAPTIRIEPADMEPIRQALSGVVQFDWLILTSVNGVDVLSSVLKSMDADVRHLAGIQVAAIGQATADRLAGIGIRPDCVPEQFVAEKLAESLIARDSVQGKRFLLLRADAARQALRDMLEQAGGACVELPAYHTLPARELDADALSAIESGELDWITFTSSSTASNLHRMLGNDAFVNLSQICRIASIGPITSNTLQTLGLEPSVQADPHTIEGLVQAIVSAE